MDQTYPHFVKQKLAKIKDKGGVLSCSDKQYTYILLAAGERPTGGYDIHIVSADIVTNNDQPHIQVIAKEKRPAPTAVVTQALTYPTSVYRISRTDLPIQVQWVVE